MKNILIVETYPALVSLYRDVLEDEGHRVFVASKAKEAIDLVQKKRIDLTIVGESLPDARQEEFIEELNRIEKQASGTICATRSLKKPNELCDENYIKSADYGILKEKVKKLLKESGSA